MRASPPPTGGYPSRRRRAAKVDIGCDTDGPRPPRQWYHHWADTDPPRPSVSGFRRNARRRPHVPVGGPLTGAAALENCRDTVAPKPPRARASLGAGGGMSLTRRTGNHARGASRQVRPELQLPPAGRIDPPGQLRSRPSPWSSPPQAATRGATAGLIPSGCGGARVHPESARQRLRIRGRGYLAVHLALSRAAYPSAAELTSGR